MIYLFSIYLIWGTVFLVIKIALNQGLSPLLLAALSPLTSGGMIMVYYIIMQRRQLFVIPKQTLKLSAVTGIGFWGVSNLLLYYGTKYVPSALAAVLFGSAPLWGICIDKLFFKQIVTRIQIVSIVIGFLGVALALLDKPIQHIASNTVLAGFIITFAACIWAGVTSYQKHHYKAGATSDVLFCGLQQIFGGSVALVVFIFIDGQLQRFNATGAMSLLYLAVFEQLIAMVCYSKALKVLPASTVMTFALVNPIIALVAGVLVLSESFAMIQFLGILLVIAALANLLIRGNPTRSGVGH